MSFFAITLKVIDFLTLLWYNGVMRVVYRKDIGIANRALKKGEILGAAERKLETATKRLDNDQAIRKLLTMKQRPVGSGKILTLMLPSVDVIPKYAEVDMRKLNMARHYFPGELTIILPKRKDWHNPYYDNFDNIGIRIPDYAYMLELLKASGPLFVTSANPRGEAPCYSHKELRKRMPEVDAVIEGYSGGNLPSTVVDWTSDTPRVVRQGGLLIVRYDN